VGAIIGTGIEIGPGPRASQGGVRGPAGLAAIRGVRHSSRRMLAPLRKLTLIALLLVAAPMLRPEPALSAQRVCDRRVLPTSDTLSVEAAARAVADGKLPDIHVHQACITGTLTSVTLVRPNREGDIREWWSVSCDRERSTWFKRGGWKCEAPELRRGMILDVALHGTSHTIGLAFSGRIPFETAEGLTRRAYSLLESSTPPPYCKSATGPFAPTSDAQSNWDNARKSSIRFFDYGDVDAFVQQDEQGFHIWPFGYVGTTVGFEFPPATAADPATASGCWGQWLFLD
jgi:hypothetical protein